MQINAGIGGLCGHGDNDEESEDGGDDQDASAEEKPPGDPKVTEIPQVAEPTPEPGKVKAC